MTNIDKYAPGSFCWIELGTTDQKAAKEFYGALFGWKADDMPIGENHFYTMFKLGDRTAAAGYTLRPDEKSHGVPPHWNLYVAVENADKSAKRATEAGGKVLKAPFDVYDAGRMAVIQDPTGAAFCIWQTKGNAGVGIAGVDGTLCWADLSTPDPDRARKFYSILFGWELNDDTDDDPPSGYVHVQNGEEFIGGISPVAHRDPHIPPHWLPYFQTSNCDATAAQAKKLGAKFCLEPMTMENVGRFGVLADPQGATFAIFQAMPRK
jgi:predicted enzyme related to lactoylglutathione lyase